MRQKNLKDILSSDIMYFTIVKLGFIGPLLLIITIILHYAQCAIFLKKKWLILYAK